MDETGNTFYGGGRWDCFPHKTLRKKYPWRSFSPAFLKGPPASKPPGVLVRNRDSWPLFLKCWFSRSKAGSGTEIFDTHIVWQYYDWGTQICFSTKLPQSPSSELIRTRCVILCPAKLINAFTVCCLQQSSSALLCLHPMPLDARPPCLGCTSSWCWHAIMHSLLLSLSILSCRMFKARSGPDP